MAKTNVGDWKNEVSTEGYGMFHNVMIINNTDEDLDATHLQNVLIE